MSDTTPTITMYFNWKGFAPDTRQYKPSAPYIEANHMIAIDVPLSTDLIKNSTAIMSQQLTNQTEEVPLLTPLGMRYCIDQFEIAMSNVENKVVSESTEDGWADVEEEEVFDKSSKVSTDDEWDKSETDEPSVEKSDEKWDEDWN